MDWIKRHQILLVVATVACTALLAALFSRKPELPVRAESPVREPISSTITTNGKVEAVDNFEAHAPGPASVRRVLVKEGDAVKAGQLLVQLDDADARVLAARALAQLRAAEANLAAIRKGGTQEEVLTAQSDLIKAQSERDRAVRNLDAIRKLRDTGAASEGELQEAISRVKRAEAEFSLAQSKLSARYSNPEVAKVEAQALEARTAYEAAQSVLRNSNITAPRAGTVYSLTVRDGMFVSTGDMLVQVADLSRMRIRAFVDEPEIGKLQIRQRVQITWDALPGRVWDGSVIHVPTAVVTRGTRNVGEMICSVDNRDRKLLPNTNVGVTVVTAQEENALTVPREAVFKDDDHSYVFEIADGRLKHTDIGTAISSLTRIQVTSGLTEKSLIALGATNDKPLVAGIEVKVVGK